jgi:predicted metal-dependent enzyme (double-stranded beta helix superfamily)
VTVSVDRGAGLQYAHHSVAGARGLAGVLAPRQRWSRRDLVRLTRRFVTRAADELYLAARFDPVERWQLRLALTEEVEVVLLTWTPSQATAPHDHRGAEGAYTVLHGELTEIWPGRHGRIKRTVRPAGSSASYAADRVHTVQNRGPLEAISVHAYSPPLATAADRSGPYRGSG